MSRPGWRTSKWIRRYGQWVVTSYGVESLYPDSPYHYYLKFEDLYPDSGHTAEEHMDDKGWVNMTDFQQAADHARRIFPERHPVRYKRRMQQDA